MLETMDYGPGQKDFINNFYNHFFNSIYDQGAQQLSAFLKKRRLDFLLINFVSDLL